MTTLTKQQLEVHKIMRGLIPSPVIENYKSKKEYGEAFKRVAIRRKIAEDIILTKIKTKTHAS